VKKSLVSLIVTGLVGASAVASAESRLGVRDEARQGPAPVVEAPTLSSIRAVALPPWWVLYFQPTWLCEHWDGTSCTSAELANPWYRQILLLPTGYQEADRAQFWTDFHTMRTQMANAGNTWSTQKRNQILWIGYFVPGDPLGTTANFGGFIAPHPVRGLALTLSNQAVYDKVASIQSTTLASLRPMGTMVIFNAQPTDKVTANAAPPSFTGKSFGIAKMTRKDLGTPYIATHELAHASLNFLDEYVEDGMQDLNIHSLDVLTPLAYFDGSWSSAITAINNLIGNYDYKISDILAANGNVNIATISTPSTVYSPISAPMQYAYEGGMFFGRGTFHMAGDNLMNGSRVQRGPGDTFAYSHSGDQQQQIETAFGAPAYRANDRLRDIGPLDGWPLALGSTTHVMWYDGDKLNHAHPTQYYVVEVGWWERDWYTAWWGPFPYPAYNDVWKTAQKSIWPASHTINLGASSLWGLANLAQGVVCEAGIITEIKGFKLCDQPLDQVAAAFLPSLNMTFFTPYDETDVPASQWFTTYWWHMATWNGTTYSGWTGWSSFFRSF